MSVPDVERAGCWLCTGTGKAWSFADPVAVQRWVDSAFTDASGITVACNCCHGSGDCAGRCDYLREGLP